MTQNGETIHELLVLDQRRSDWTTLLAQVGGGTMVLVLDRQRDGLSEILDATRDRGPFARIRIADAGSPGRLCLGGLVLDMPAMAGREDELAALGDRLSPGGVLELCGGGGGTSAAGGRFAAALARLLERDVHVPPAAVTWMPSGVGALVPAAFVVEAAQDAAGRHQSA